MLLGRWGRCFADFSVFPDEDVFGESLHIVGLQKQNFVAKVEQRPIIVMLIELFFVSLHFILCADGDDSALFDTMLFCDLSE